MSAGEIPYSGIGGRRCVSVCAAWGLYCDSTWDTVYRNSLCEAWYRDAMVGTEIADGTLGHGTEIACLTLVHGTEIACALPTQTHKHTDRRTHRHTDTQTHRHTVHSPEIAYAARRVRHVPASSRLLCAYAPVPTPLPPSYAMSGTEIPSAAIFLRVVRYRTGYTAPCTACYRPTRVLLCPVC
eukprot:3499697-Rhodomonas_salina.6